MTKYLFECIKKEMDEQIERQICKFENVIYIKKNNDTMTNTNNNIDTLLSIEKLDTYMYIDDV